MEYKSCRQNIVDEVEMLTRNVYGDLHIARITFINTKAALFVNCIC